MNLGILDGLLLLATLAMLLAVVVPFTGVLIRFRANYNPKGLQLDAEGSAAPHTGPVVKSYFAMFKRVYKIEGWAGLYKGLMPTLLSTLAVTIFVVLFLDVSKPRGHSKYRAPEAGILGTLFYSMLMLVISLPTTILTYRSVTTPTKLSSFKLMHALRVLLTPTERRSPWILYLTPGLMTAEVLHILFVVLVFGPLRRLLLPTMSTEKPEFGDISIFKLAMYSLIAVIATVVLTPLEVIMTRLAIQRNHSSAEYNSVQQEVEGDAEPSDEYAGEEEVIGLREEGDPYLGFVDCAKRIIHEEGVMTLYRAWWLTLIGIWGNAFV